MAERSSSAGVKSLRAMFENNGVADSPLRGRSPGGTPIQNGSERPLSKVRTAFIEVGKPPNFTNGKKAEAGDVQQSDNAHDDSRNPKVEIATGAQQSEPTQPTTQNIKATPHRSEPLPGVVRSNAPKTAIHSRKESKTKNREVKSSEASSKASNMTSAAEKPAKKQSIKTAPEVLQNLSINLQTPSKPERKPEPPTAAASLSAVDEPQEKPKDTPISSSAAQPSANGTSSIGKSPSLSPTKTKLEKIKSQQPTKSPSTSKPSPARSRPIANSALAEPRQRAISSISIATTPKKGLVESVTRVSGTRSSTGFFKPRPKSPTRPIKLPAHLIAPTASSAAKHGGPGLLDSPARSRAPVSQPVSRRASNISMVSRPAFGPLPGARKTSAIGPPPRNKVAAKVLTDSKPTSRAAPDEGFLARMMRPTTSSASKTIQGRGEVSSPPREKPKVATSKVSTPIKASTKPPNLIVNKTRPAENHDVNKHVPEVPQKEELLDLVDSPRQAEHSEPKINIQVPVSKPEEVFTAKPNAKPVVEPPKEAEVAIEQSAEPASKASDAVEQIEEQTSGASIPKTTPMTPLGSSVRKADETKASNAPSAPTDAFDELD